MTSIHAEVSIYYWIGFFIFVLAMLSLDLMVFQKKTHEIKFKEAFGWTVFWISLALLFNLLVLYQFGSQKALEFITAYLIEESLSVDNLFVFLMIFSYFAVPKNLEHRVLFWGILGAIIMRGIFIAAGTALVKRFDWTLYIFGVLLLYASIKMFFHNESEVHPERNPVIKLFSKFFPSVREYHGSKFLICKEGRLFATPLLLVLVTIESSDIIFAVDSIPAVLSISHDPFIVFTSNIFAVLGLRALFFCISGMLNIFSRLKEGVAFILLFVGTKMLINKFVHISTGLSLSVITITLILAIVASIIENKLKGEENAG
ncbi:MAG: hypothetical protein COS94_09420 [Candidatus Hydrogenedentes bacterium CG07_land_8_20_14_0_80_42_17]|nr:MAG: hypothetical protein COS94_09420 [Candidatus Hydrogenedentes bacterium CG07_land_8_20_14_0_80_42_17]